MPIAEASSPTAVASETPSSPAAALLGRVLRVTLTDGRVIIGRLHVLDWQQTIVLRNAELWRPAEELRAETPVETAKRALGLVAIEARHVTRYEVREVSGSAPAVLGDAPVEATLYAAGATDKTKV